jgi:hypothetical protein
MMNFLKRIHVFEIVLITVVLSLHLYAALSDAYNLPNTWFTRDDAYYYFKVAQNITEGHGSTFDGINPTNGYHPLWMLVCIPVFVLARYDLILPLRVLLMVMALFNAATAILIYRLVKSNLSPSVAMTAASFWSFNLYIHYTVYEFGLETPLAAFGIVLFIYKLSQFEREWRTRQVTTGQLGTLAFTAVIVLFSRLDLIFLAVIAGIWIVFRGRPLRWLLPLDMVAVFLSMVTSVALRTNIEIYNSQYAASAVEAAVIGLAIKLIALYSFGLYQHPRTRPVWTTIQQAFLALTTSGFILFVIYFILSQLGIGKIFPRSAFVIDWGICTLLILAIRMAAHWFGGEQIAAIPQTLTPAKEFQQNWRTWLGEGSVYFGILGSALALYMLFNKIAFGTTSPVSGQIKRWWGTLGKTVYDYPPSNWTSFFGISFRGVYDAWQPTSNFFAWFAGIIKPLYPGSNTTDERYFIVMAAAACIMLLILFLKSQRAKEKISNMAIIPLMAGGMIQILSYTTTAYAGAKEWYWVSQMVLIVLVESILLDCIINRFQKNRFGQTIFQIASMVAGIYLAANLAMQIHSRMRYNYFPSNRPYMEVLPYLEENTPPGAVIGMTGGGNVGYFIHDRTIVNMDGLINSYDYFKAVQNGDAAAYLRQHNVQIIFASPRLLGLPPYFGQFDRYLQSYSRYGGKGLMYLLTEPKN